MIRQTNALARALVLLPFLLLAIGAGPATAISGGFAFKGAPVHPRSVQPLVGDLADEQPSVAAVDLEGSAGNKSNSPKPVVRNGLVDAKDGEGWVAYRYVGVTPGGLHVLIVMVNGGGTGVFENVLWVKFVHDTVWEDGQSRDRTMLVKVGRFILGDRDDGRVSLEGSRLFIGKSRYREADTSINLE